MLTHFHFCLGTETIKNWHAVSVICNSIARKCAKPMWHKHHARRLYVEMEQRMWRVDWADGMGCMDNAFSIGSMSDSHVEETEEEGSMEGTINGTIKGGGGEEGSYHGLEVDERLFGQRH